MSRALAGLLAAAWLAAAAAPACAQASPGSGVVRTEPGAASSEMVEAPPAAPPLLGWIALGASGLALLAAGAALGVALAARSRAGEVAEAAGARPALDPRTAKRLDELEARVRTLAAPPPERPAADASTTDRAFPPRAPADHAAPAPRAESPAPPAEALHTWIAELTEAFAALARDPSSAAAGYIARRRPQAAALGPEGVMLGEGFEGAKLWAVRAPGGGEAEVWALTPGEQAVMNWSAHFAPQRTQLAAEVFGDAFELVDGGGEALRMDAPAILRRDASGRLSVRRRGRLSGFRG